MSDDGADLVRILREAASRDVMPLRISPLLAEAADAIDALTAERDRVLGWNKALTGRDADKEVHDLSMQLTMERARLAATEAERDEANKLFESAWNRAAAAERVIEEARQTIAQLPTRVQLPALVDALAVYDGAEKAYSANAVTPMTPDDIPATRSAALSELQHTRWSDIKAKRKATDLNFSNQPKEDE